MPGLATLLSSMRPRTVCSLTVMRKVLASSAIRTAGGLLLRLRRRVLAEIANEQNADAVITVRIGVRDEGLDRLGLIDLTAG